MAEMQIKVVTPEKATLDQPCEFVALPMIDGELGVLPGHAPMIGRLTAGEMRVRAGGKDARYYVDGGFVQIEGSLVSVLTEKSIPAAEIDLAAAKEALAEALKQPFGNSDTVALREKAVAQAKAQIRLSEKV